MKKDELTRILGQIEGKLDALIHESHNSRMEMDGVYKRINVLEKKQHGILLVASIGFATILAFAKKLFN